MGENPGPGQNSAAHLVLADAFLLHSLHCGADDDDAAGASRLVVFCLKRFARGLVGGVVVGLFAALAAGRAGLGPDDLEDFAAETAYASIAAKVFAKCSNRPWGIEPLGRGRGLDQGLDWPMSSRHL